jgi:long-chain acyl-CoA synthetase
VLPQSLKRLGDAAARRAQDAILSGWLKPRVMGAGNIPANRNVVVVANHASHVVFALVRYALGRMGDNLVVLAAKDYFFNTGLRRLIARNFSPLIPFDRERAQLESLDEAIAELAAGRSVLMFPEGTRSTDGALHEFKSGAGYLALRGGCDILPIHIKGSFKVLGKGQLLPRRHPVEVRIGAVIARDALVAIAGQSEGAGAYRKLADFLRQSVASLAVHVPAPRRTRKPEHARGRTSEPVAAPGSQ